MRPTIDKFGDNGILFRWPEAINEETHYEILSLDAFLQKKYDDVINETVLAYTSLAAFFKESLDTDEFIKDFEWPQLDTVEVNLETVTYVVPVCYEPHFAMDLPRVAEHCGMKEEEVILLHTSVNYDVRFIGFLPGFPYLSGLDRRLYTPRIEEPRKFIEKGSVGIGGKQTGIYTMNSPGGWNIIGKCPLKLFDINNSPPSLFQPGDKLVFKAISMQEYERISRLADRGNFEVQKLL
jgi:inhibitor of KinA